MIEKGCVLSQEDRLRLQAHRLFHDLEEGPREQLLGAFAAAEAEAGTPLLREGHSNTRLTVILAGHVRVDLPKAHGRPSEVHLAELGPGDTLGEYSLFDRHPVSATVLARTTVRVAWIEKAALDAFVAASPDSGRRFYDALVRMLVARLRAKDAELDIFTIG